MGDRVPSLESLCVSAATEGSFWKVQRRSLERLPEHAANELLALLLVRQPAEIRPATVELFRHCVTRLELLPPCGGAAAGLAGQAVAAAVSFGPDWAAALAGFNHLAELRMPGCSRLTVAALQALLLPAPAAAKAHASAGAAAATAAAAAVVPAGSSRQQPPCRSPAAAALRRLDVAGCSRLGDEAAALIARCCCGSEGGDGCCGQASESSLAAASGPADGLVALDITETSITGAGLRHLSTLAGLTELRAGGLKACTDADWCALLPHLPALRRLDAWGTDAGDGGDGGEQLLAVLATTATATATSTTATANATSTTATATATTAAAGSSAARSGGWGAASSSGVGCSYGESGGSGSSGSSGSSGMHRLEQLSLAWTRVRVAPAFPALQVLDLRHCQLEDVWWPGGSDSGGGGAALPLRQLLLRGAVVSGRAAAVESGVAVLIRRAAATLELLDLADVTAPCSAAAATAVGGGAWPLPLATLAGAAYSSAGAGGGGGGGGAPRLTHLDISRTAVPAEQLEELQHAPVLRKLVAAGCRGAGSARGAAALVSAGLGQLKELDLSGAGVTDECVSWLQQLSSLTSLNLSGNPALSLAPPPPPPPPPAPAPEQVQQPQQQDQAERADAVADVWQQGGQPAAQNVGAAARGGSNGNSRRSSEDGDEDDGCSSSGRGLVWPQLSRLNLLGTRVTEGGLRALLSALTGSGHRRHGQHRGDRTGGSGSDGGSDGGSSPLAASVLEQLKLGGGGFTDGAAAALAAARLPRLHSLLVRDAPMSGHGAMKLASGGGGGGSSLPALRRLELQACWLVSPQDAARAASCLTAAAAAAAGTGAAAGPVLVVVNGKAAGVAAAAAPAPARSGAATSTLSSASASTAAATTSATAKRQAATSRRGGSAGAAAAAAAAVAGDLSAYDQRMRYSREELVLLLAASPLAGGGAAGCSWPEELGEAPSSALVWEPQAAAAGDAGCAPADVAAPNDGSDAAAGGPGASTVAEATAGATAGAATAQEAAAAAAAAARAAVLALLPADLLRPVGARGA